MGGQWKWHCAKKGHIPILQDRPLDEILVGDTYMVGNICSQCGCVYYYPSGEKQGVIVRV